MQIQLANLPISLFYKVIDGVTVFVLGIWAEATCSAVPFTLLHWLPTSGKGENPLIFFQSSFDFYHTHFNEEMSSERHRHNKKTKIEAKLREWEGNDRLQMIMGSQSYVSPEIRNRLVITAYYGEENQWFFWKILTIWMNEWMNEYKNDDDVFITYTLVANAG